MLLDRIKIKQFAGFKDTELTLDPKVTVLVGRNDVGKTTLIRRLLSESFTHEYFWSGDVTRDPAVNNKGHIHFEMIWIFNDADNKKFDLPKTFDLPSVDSVKTIIKFFPDIPSANYKRLSLEVNGKQFETSKKILSSIGSAQDNIGHFVKKILPKVRYITLSERQFLPSMFGIRFYDPNKEKVWSLGDTIRTEETLIKLIGLGSICREGWKDVNDPWSLSFSFPNDITIEDIKERCVQISKKITSLLQKWWDSPSNLTFTFDIVGDENYLQEDIKINSFIGRIEVKDDYGLPHYGAGLRWFIAFLIEYLNIKENKENNLLVFDEPAITLHPSAQKLVVGLLNELSDEHQIIYTTHSPFLLDWYAPQRIRVIERGDSNKVSKIENKPYKSLKPFSNFWWPLRDSIGLSLGDIGLLGENNLLVEGESDKILLANFSRYRRDRGKVHLDLNILNIISLNSNKKLADLIIQIANSQNKKIFGLFDSDKSGRGLKALFEKYEKEVLEIDTFIESSSAQVRNSIEDLIGITDYVSFVNEFYKDFRGWFQEIAENEIRKKKNSLGDTLGKIMEDHFIASFGNDHKFSKASVAIHIASQLTKGTELININKFESLFEKINKINFALKESETSFPKGVVDG
jgi:predicted ATP-dependent endonuclease of OLD family